MGVNVPALRVLAYAISSFLGGVGGAIFVAIAQSIYPSSFTVNDSVNFMLNCFLGGSATCSARCSARSCSISAGTSCSRRAQYQLLIYSGVMILLMLASAERALQPAPAARGAGAEPMAPILEVKDLTKRYGGLIAVNDVSFDVASERNPLGHRPERRRQVDHLQTDLVVREADPRRGDVQGRGHFRPRAAYRGAQGRGAHVSGDDDLQGHDGARQRHRRPSPALAREPSRLLSRNGGGAAR